MPGPVVSVREIVDMIELLVPKARGQITFDDQALPFPIEIDGTALLNALGHLPQTPFTEGVMKTIATFRRAVAKGLVG
jgi:nucleoside-diphosphate-sugar epimerase